MNKKTKLLLAAILTAALALVLNYAVNAAFDETEAVHVDAAAIENSTLAVGTHLIHLSAITDELYKAAVESAAESGQDRRYYKSELGDGAWYDITEAADISAITINGTPIEDEVINQLFFCYHTKSDGITYDLREGGKVSVFDIMDPYDIRNLPELEPLLQQYKLISQKESKTDMDAFHLKILNTFYAVNVTNEITQVCDRELAALQNYEAELRENKEKAERLSVVMEVMGTIDAERRAEVLRILNDSALPTLLEWVNGYNWIEDELLEEFTESTDLSTAVGSSQENVGQSLIERQADMLHEGTTIFSKKRFDYSNLLILEADKNKYSDCDMAVNKLLHLSNIENGTIADAQGELELLETELISSADAIYMAAIARGCNEKYKAGVAANSSGALLNQLLQTQQSETSVYRLEMQTLIQAKTDRMTTESAKEYIVQRIEQVDELRNTIQTDAFQRYADETTDAYLIWLTEKLKELTEKNGGTQLSKMISEKADLQTQRLDCLDRNDLAGAKKLEALIGAKDEDIAAIEDRLNAIINADTTSDADRALAQSALGNGTAASALQDVTDSAIADIRLGDTQGLAESLDGIASMYELNPDAAQEALKKLYKELAVLQQEEYMEQIADIMAEHIAVHSDVLSSDEIYALLAEILGENFAQLREEDKCSALIAVNWYAGYTGKEDVIRLAGKIAHELHQEKNGYLYGRLEGQVKEYAAIDALAICIGYRYIFEDDAKLATIQKGAKYYKFRAADSQVLREGNQTEEMEQTARFQNVIHLSEDYIYDKFKCQIEYILQTSYGVIASEKMMQTAEDLFAVMIERGEN